MARILGAVGITAIYAVCFVAIKAGLAFAPPLLFGGLRALIGGTALLGLVIIRREPIVPDRPTWPGLLALAATATTITFGAMFLSPGRTGAGIGSVLGNMQPLITVALAAIFLSERLSHGKVAALMLGLGGVTLIAYPALAAADAYGISGAALALVVSVGSASGNVIVKRMRVRHGLLAITAWQLIIGSLPLLALSALVERGMKVTWSAEFIGLVVFLALVGTSFVTAAWYWLIQHGDVGQLTMFFFLVPVFGLGVAALVFKEAVSLLESVGVVLMVGAIGATAWESWHATTPSQAALHPGSSTPRP
ncbi:MAG: DMT family transporter [Chloroflexi bacterium]|nr:DMT family transporter [Chloroflexota bacterium]